MDSDVGTGAPAGIVSGTTKSARLVYLELVRAIAIFLVVFNHTGADGYYLYLTAHNKLVYAFDIFLTVGCKIAVPLFFMVSGALLLPRDESLSTLFRKRVLRFVLVIVIFSIFQYIYFLVNTGAPFDIGFFLRATYSSGMLAPQYWFLYAYLGGLLLLPFLRKMAVHLRPVHFIYLFVLELVFIGILPVFEYLLKVGPAGLSVLPVVTSVVFFFLMGYFFENYVGEKFYRPRYAVIAVVCAIAVIEIAGFITRLQIQQTRQIDWYLTLANNLIAVPTISAFFLIKYAYKCRAWPSWLNRAIVWFGANVFAVYLLENMFRDQLEPLERALRPHLHRLPACFVWVICTVIAGTIAAVILRRIPLLKRLL